jgi:hypothetical protein
MHQYQWQKQSTARQVCEVEGNIKAKGTKNLLFKPCRSINQNLIWCPQRYVQPLNMKEIAIIYFGISTT